MSVTKKRFYNHFEFIEFAFPKADKEPGGVTTNARFSLRTAWQHFI
jgi:hypothetical protein